MKKLNRFDVGAWKFLWVVGLWFLAPISCTSLKQLAEPKVEVESVSFDRLEGRTAHLIFHGRIQNPNSVKLQMDAIKYQLLVNNEAVSAADYREPITVDALSENTFALPVAFGLDQVFKSLLAAFQDRKLNYKILGDMQVGWFRVPFSKDGVIDLDEALKK